MGIYIMRKGETVPFPFAFVLCWWGKTFWVCHCPWMSLEILPCCSLKAIIRSYIPRCSSVLPLHVLNRLDFISFLSISWKQTWVLFLQCTVFISLSSFSSLPKSQRRTDESQIPCLIMFCFVLEPSHQVCKNKSPDPKPYYSWETDSSFSPPQLFLQSRYCLALPLFTVTI